MSGVQEGRDERLVFLVTTEVGFVRLVDPAVAHVGRAPECEVVLADAAGSSQSESWVLAQQAVSAAVAARAPTTRALGDIDEIAATELARRGGIAPANLAAIEAAAAEVGAIDRRQAEAIDDLEARLGG